MTENPLVYWLWVVMVMGIAYRETPFLTEKFSNIQEMYRQMLDPDCSFMKAGQKKRALQISLAKAEAVLESCNKKKINIMTWNSEYYPDDLRRIYNPPALLFYKGNPAFLRNTNLLTVVGTRHPSEHSQYIAEKLCDELARSGYTLVSGCAVGLDMVAHRAAIRNEKPTIAVLGCGIDHNYPRGSRELKEKIIENGLLITEFFPGTIPYGPNFPIRNRIMIGISKALLVTEAKLGSGCLVTANLACEQGKPVFCIPPSDIYAERYAGQTKLLREGAFPVYGIDEIIQETKPEESSSEQIVPEQIDQPAESESESKSDPESEPDLNDEIHSLLPEEQAILKALAEGKKNSNMLCNITGMKFESITIHLVELEIMDWIRCSERDFYQLTEKYYRKTSA